MKSLALPSLVFSLCSGPAGIALALFGAANHLPEPTKESLGLSAFVVTLGGSFMFACVVRATMPDDAPARLRQFANFAIAAPIAWGICIAAFIMYALSQV
jgi:ribose/xylose/arabinose/galactoside ABC-type transport system permease subunit